MNILGDKLFRFTEESVKRMRYIKLNKKASYSEKGLHNITYNKIEQENDAIQFYAFGFYDSLTCMKPKQLSSVSHKEHCLISYPFQKTANTLNVEQWFGILPLSEPKRYGIGADSDFLQDPFFCDDDLQKELPFVGVVLLSLGSGAKGEMSNFKELLLDFTEKCTGVFLGEPYSSDKYIAELYYSLNCVDLCLGIRTDDLSFIHDVNYKLNRAASGSGYNVNSTVLFAIQYRTDNDNYRKLTAKNDRVSFVVRSNEKYIEKTKEKNEDRSRGVNGVGRYVTELKYEEYMEILPDLVSYKLDIAKGNESSSHVAFAHSICHEREWFKEKDSQEHCLKCDDGTEKLQMAICSWIREIHGMVSEIESFADNLFQYDRELYKYKEIFTREIRLIKDLVYAYSDLWYQNSSENGFVFFTQLMAALQGVKTLLQEIDCVHPNNVLLESSVEDFLEVMHWIACDLNGYNKQFQFLNQDSVNFPIYEIQSKVNSEKYMAAYCSFLHKFFVLYYQEKKDVQLVVQNLPLALVDLNQRKIIARVFFSSQYRKKTKLENRQVRGIFAVHFPSSEYFSDLWNSIPLLMHEASHTHNYGEMIERNQAVVFHINRFFAEIIAREMLKVVNDGIMISTSSVLLEILKERVFHVICAHQEKFFEEIGGFESWGFQILREKCKDFYIGIFDRCVHEKKLSYNQFVQIKDRTQRDVDYIMQVLGFQEICYVFTEQASSIPAVFYFINTLYLEFNPEFYKKYKAQYDGRFLENLETEINSDDKEVVEQEILQLAWYRFKKFVKCADTNMDEHVKSIARDQEDSLVIAFSVVQIAAMRAIFEKYRHKFLQEISEKKYCDELIVYFDNSNLSEFSNMLTDAYKSYVTKQEDGSKPSMHDCSLLEAMFCEYYEVYLSINNVVRYLVREYLLKDEFLNRNGTGKLVELFVESVHRECKQYIRKEEEKEGFKAVFTKSNREQLMRLGFLEESAVILKKVFAKIFASCDNEFVEETINDRTELFKEVYADCGMCCAMGFKPFGYCMFGLSVYDLVHDENAAIEKANFRADRIRAVIGMSFHKATKKEWTEKLNEFLQKLCDIDMIMSICKMLQLIYDKGEVAEIYHRVQEDDYRISVERENDETEIFQKDFKETFLKWRDDIIGSLINLIENEYERDITEDAAQRDKLVVAKAYLFHVHNIMKLFAAEDILSHIPKDMFGGFFQHIEGIMMEGEGIKAVKNDPCVSEISQFYNMDCPEDVEDKFEWYYTVYTKGFITQCNFIFDNYCEYRNAYNNIKRNVHVSEDGEVNLKINQWFEVIDEYYQREGM